MDAGKRRHLAWQTWLGRPGARLVLHRALLRVRVVGLLRRRYAAVQVGHAAGAMLASGGSVIAALGAAGEAVSDQAVRAALAAATEAVRTGERLAPSLARAGVFLLEFLHMVEVGEERARLAEMLERASRLMEDELGRDLGRLVRLAEPAMIVAFGGAVGLVAVALLQAIYGIHGGVL